jgi:hypothetical protein
MAFLTPEVCVEAQQTSADPIRGYRRFQSPYIKGFEMKDFEMKGFEKKGFEMRFLPGCLSIEALRHDRKRGR